MSEGDTKDHAILRVLYVIIFYLIYGLTDIVLLFITLVQTVLNLFGSGPSQSLRLFGSSMGQYVDQITQYLSYASEEKPFPFSDWPAPENLDKE